jgi:rod shape-determining protein MreC
VARTTTRFGSKLDLFLFGVCAVLALVATILPENLHEPISASLRRSVVAPLVGLQQGAERWRSAWVTSHQRALARDSLAIGASEANALRIENDRLRRALGLGQRLQWGFVPAEALHGGSTTDQFERVLTAGSNAGVAVGSPVVAPEGLVGTVQTVDPRISVAIIYPHSEFRASAMAADGSAFGIVSPHISGDAQEATAATRGVRPDRFMLELRGVPFRRNLPLGTLIVTSGLGGTYPSGIPVGTIVAELKTPEVWARTYLLRPVVNPSEITNVMILSAPKVREGTGAVWEAPTAIDSAMRGVVTAGDSIYRAAAAMEAARRAALDSAVRASRPDTTPRDSVRRDSAGGVRPNAASGATPAAARPAAGQTPSGAARTTSPPTPRRDTTRPTTGTLPPRPR